MSAAAKKFLDVIFKHMTKAELVKLHAEWDSDGDNELFHQFTERLAPLAPEVFTAPDIDKKVMKSDG